MNIYDYLINCEDFNNLNENGDMVGTGIMAGICTSPYSSYPYPYSYPVNAGFPSKRRQIRTIPTGVGLFVISTSWEPMEELKMSLSPIEP